MSWAPWIALGAVGIGALSFALPMAGAVALGTLGAAGLKVAYEKSSWGKIDRDVFIGRDESLEDIKSDVDSAMRKIQFEFVSGKFQAVPLTETGRDEPVYALRKWMRKTGLGDLIRQWNDRWSLEDTAGLLLDAGSKIKAKPEFTKELPITGENLLSPSHETVRQRNKTFKLKGESEQATWARGIRRDFVVNAGPSATTATLLNFLSVFPNITTDEREAILQAAILFWRGNTKRGMGDYHTGAEVWMAYTRRLQLEGTIKKDNEL